MIDLFYRNEEGQPISNFELVLIIPEEYGNRKTSRNLNESLATLDTAQEVASFITVQNATATGATIGSIIPVVGTGIGAGIGAAVGFVAENFSAIRNTLFPLLADRVPTKNAVGRLLRAALSATNISTIEAVSGESAGFVMLNPVINTRDLTGVLMDYLAELKRKVANGLTWEELRSGDVNRRHLYQALEVAKIVRGQDVNDGVYGMNQKVLAGFGYTENGNSPEFVQALESEARELQSFADAVEESNREPSDEENENNILNERKDKTKTRNKFISRESSDEENKNYINNILSKKQKHRRLKPVSVALAALVIKLLK
jgi:hypothetical protein